MSIRHSARFTQDGVYVERFDPPKPDGRPAILMLHGGGHTGSCWLATADGRPGWAYRLAGAGWPVLVVDWPGHGRSGAIDPDQTSGELVCQRLAGAIDLAGGPVVLLTHSMGGALGWRLAELRAGQIAAIVGVAPGPPGNIQPQGEIIREDADTLWVRQPTRTARIPRHGFSVGDKDFVENKLVGASARFPRAYLASYAASLTPTAARLLYERQNTLGTQVRVSDTTWLAGKPVLVVTGEADLDHPRAVDAEVVDWLRAQGAACDFIWLADQGISGNGHMLMMEENSDQIADLIAVWLAKTLD